MSTFDATKQRGNSAFAANNFDEAIALYTSCIQMKPADPVIYSNRCIAYLKAGQPEKALDDAQKCLKLNPKWPKAQFRVGQSYYALNQYRESAIAFSFANQLAVAQRDASTSRSIMDEVKVVLKDCFVHNPDCNFYREGDDGNGPCLNIIFDVIMDSFDSLTPSVFTSAKYGWIAFQNMLEAEFNKPIPSFGAAEIFLFVAPTCFMMLALLISGARKSFPVSSASNSTVQEWDELMNPIVRCIRILAECCMNRREFGTSASLRKGLDSIADHTSMLRRAVPSASSDESHLAKNIMMCRASLQLR